MNFAIWHDRAMDNCTTNHEQLETADAFHTTLVENIDTIVEALRVVGHELALTGETHPAEFFDRMAEAIEAFRATWTDGQARLSTRSLTRLPKLVDLLRT